MPKVLVTESNLEDIADAIRERSESEDTYLPSEMAAAIRSIPAGSDSPVTGVKGDQESEYRTGDVNITPANIGAKAAQSAVSNPTASGTAVAFIDGITQNEQGVISPTKKTVRSATTSLSGLMSSTDKTKLNGIETGAQVNTITGVKGNAENSYRTGDVNLTPANIGAAAIEDVTRINTGLAHVIKKRSELTYPIKAGTCAYDESRANIYWAIRDIANAEDDVNAWLGSRSEAYALAENTKIGLATLGEAITSAENDIDGLKTRMTAAEGDIAAMPNEKRLLSDAIKARMIDLMKHAAYAATGGAALLTALCAAMDVDGWIDLMPNKSIDSSGAVVPYADGTRCASDYIPVMSDTECFAGTFETGAPKYAVCCYDSGKTYLGRATDYNGGTGAISGSSKRWFVSGTAYIRLLCVDGTVPALAAAYTGRMLTLTYDSDATKTAIYAFSEAVS